MAERSCTASLTASTPLYPPIARFASPGTVYRFEKSLHPAKDSVHYIKFDDDEVPFEEREEVPVVLVRTKHGRTIGRRFILQSDENIC